MVRLGSLCTGYGGLDLAVEAVLNTEVKWLAEYEDAPAQVCEVRFPGVPNLRDLTAVDWTTVEPIDVLTAGYPCQPFSHAGKREGTNDARHLWPHIADAVRVLRPALVVLENVAGHLSLGFDAVLGDLADLGFDAEWCVVRASDVGACHQRARLFIAATDTRRGEWSAPRRGEADGSEADRSAGVSPRSGEGDSDADGSGRWPRSGKFGGMGAAGLVEKAAPGNARHGTRGTEHGQQPGQLPVRPRQPSEGAAANAGSTGARRDGGTLPRAQEPRRLQPQADLGAVDPLRAAAADTGRGEPERRGGSGQLGAPTSRAEGAPRKRERVRDPALDRREDAPDTDLGSGDGREPEQVGGSGRRTTAPGAGQDVHADTDDLGCEGAIALAWRDHRGGGEGSLWGDYGPAIDRHAAALGRPAPSPVDERGRLSPRFVEWMMMLPDGWVTDVLTTRTKALKCLGNGVVPAQAAYAIAGLLERLDERIAA